jgi:apolipoprotein N-acyltransferase
VAALSLPPFGWWPLGFLGVALLSWSLDALRALPRLAAGTAFGMGLFGIGLWWMNEFHFLGAALAMLIEASFFAVACVLVPRGRWSVVALPAALVIAEAGRSVVPFSGVPLAGIALGQSAGPLAGAARIGGELLVFTLAVLAGLGLALLARRRFLSAAVSLGLVLAGAAAGAVSPDGGGGPEVTTAIVQGGGRRGFSGVESDPQAVLDATLEASRDVRPPVSLILWPEDVVDVDAPVGDTPEGRSVAEVARRTGATVVAGVIEASGPDRFFNAAVAWSPEGNIVDRYDKVERVPFGEYIPARGVVERVADVSAVPRDAIVGRRSGVLRTPAGPIGVAISYEVFFSSRSRAATGTGARLLAVPTNAASFSSSQVPAQEVAAARLRAIENGRDILQAAPTGYGAYIDNRGRLRARTTLGRRQVIQRPATMRSGRTVYAAAGDAPLLGMAAIVLALAWLSRGGVLRSRRT